MQDWMHKHRRIIMYFILVFICVPFVFMFGMPSSCGGRSQEVQDRIVAQVGEIPIMESEFRRSLDRAIAMRRGQGGETPTYRELDQDGTVQRVLENLVDAALVRLLDAQRNFKVDRDLMSAQMQKWDMFQNENGEFNHEAWNEWVGSVTRWDEIFEDVGGGITQQVFLSTVSAPSGRILNNNLEEELKADHVKLRVKFAKIEPAINPTEEELRAHYDQNTEMYRLPEQVKAELMVLSLAPPMPELATQLVERARSGEDFTQLANEHSSLSEPAGGEMGWRTEEEFMGEHLKPLFALLPGEVSDPVPGPTGYFIYKNEEERTNEETGLREVFGRQIVLNAALSAEERTAREQKADEFVGRLQQGEEPQSVATEAGLALTATNFFDNRSTEIENVSDSDVLTFRSQVVSATDDAWKAIKSRNNIYLARVLERKQGEIPAFEEARESAVEKVVAERKQTDGYKEEVKTYTDRIKAEVSKLDDIKTQFPELNASIGETAEPFSRKDSLFQYQVYVQASEIHAALSDSEPGAVVGPLTGFLGDAWFFELIERQEPTPEELASFEGEREEIKNRMKQTAQYEMLGDFTKDLRERMLASVSYTQDTALLDAILGRNEGEDEAEASSEGEAGEGEPAPDASSSEEASGVDVSETDTAADSTQDSGVAEDADAGDAGEAAVAEPGETPAQESPAQ